jgi:environmental stress-induced protein Ves
LTNEQDLLLTSDQQWLQAEGYDCPPQGQSVNDWLQTLENKWLQNLEDDWQEHAQKGREWVWTEREDWLHKWAGNFLQTQVGKDWLETQDGQHWLQTRDGKDWLHSHGGQDWLRTHTDRDWSHITSKNENDWPQTELHAESPHDLLQTCKGREWLKTHHGRSWLQIESGRDWLQTQNGQSWLQSPDGHAWQSTLPASVWLTIEEFSITLEAMNEQTIAPDMLLLPVFQLIQQFKSLPDFLMFPVFLALRHQNHSGSPLLPPQGSRLPDLVIIHAMKAFVDFAKGEREQSTSDALKYACQNWAFHLSRAHPWNDELNRIFKRFWDSRLLSWFERQWCLKGLLSCLLVLSEGQKHAKVRGYIDYHLYV